MTLSILASELTNKNIWNPTVLGALTVVAGIVLFCGSVYLLLGTNLGARLGFLVAFTGLCGFMVVLTLLWMTTASPLNTLKGRVPAWDFVEEVSDPSESSIPAVQDIESKENEVPAPEAANVKAAVDENLIESGESTEETANASGPDTQFGAVTEYMVTETFETGGSSPQFWKLEFQHTPLYAAAQFCEVTPADPDRAFGLPPEPPECNTAEGAKTGWLIFERDLGSLRFPPFVAFLGFTLLFGLGLLMLHWRERDEQERAAAKEAAKNGPKAVTEPVPEKV